VNFTIPGWPSKESQSTQCTRLSASALRLLVMPQRSSLSLCAALLFTVSALSIPAARAQQEAPPPPPQGTMTLKVTTQIVLLDVSVTDKKGNPVNNLKPEDFTILEDAVPQRMRSFEPPSAHHMPAAEEGKLVVRSAADLKKIGDAPITLLVLDETNTAFSDMAYSRYCINKYLDAQPAIMTQPTVLLVADDTHFTVIHDYTQDREAIRESLKHYMPSLPSKMMRSNTGANAAERMSNTLGALYQIAKASAGVPGRKTIIWVGSGFPSLDVLSMSAPVADAIQGAMKRITQTLLESHVTLFTIDPTVNLTSVNMMETPEDLQFAEDQSDGQPYSDQIKFSTLAPATGGTALFSRNDIDKEVAASIEQGANYYTISYSPANKNLDATQVANLYHRIRIVMKDPTLIATTRDGYYPRVSDTPNPFALPNMDPQAKQAQLKMDITTAAMSDMSFDGITVNAERKDPANFKLTIPLKDLNWTDSTNSQQQAEISVVVVAFSAKNKALGHFGTELVARTAGDPTKSPNALAPFALTYTIPPNTTRIRFVVRDAISGKIGTVELQNK
jgi:VWFA-related protein